MTRLGKLRRSPALFFADSRHPAVRALGRFYARNLDERGLGALLEDPVAALARSRLPLIAAAVHAGEDLAARRRRARLAAHGATVSVVMAARNAAGSIGAAIDSVLAQTYPAAELIVIDDDSTDATRDVVASAAGRDGRVRLVRNPARRGAAGSRNVGLDLASGDYVTFHDADDRSHPQRLERQLDQLVRHPDAVACICNFRRETPEGTPIAINRRPIAKSIISMMFPRRRVLERIGFFLDLTISEDTEYYLRLRAVFGEDAMIYLFKTLYYARFSPGSLLFGGGSTTVEAGGVTHVRAPDVEAALAGIHERIRRIRAGELDPLVPFAP